KMTNYLMPGPWQDARVRRAINYAIDMDTIIKTVLEGHGHLLGVPLEREALGFNPAMKWWGYDPERARALLREAGYANGFEMTLHTPNRRYMNDIEVMQAMAAMLGKVGIKANVQVWEQSVYTTKWRKRELLPAYMTAWGGAGVFDGARRRVRREGQHHRPLHPLSRGEGEGRLRRRDDVRLLEHPSDIDQRLGRGQQLGRRRDPAVRADERGHPPPRRALPVADLASRAPGPLVVLRRSAVGALRHAGGAASRVAARHDQSRDPRGRRRVGGGGRAAQEGRLRRRGHPALRRPPARELHLAARQHAHRRVRRQPRQSPAPAARGAACAAGGGGARLHHRPASQRRSLRGGRTHARGVAGDRAAAGRAGHRGLLDGQRIEHGDAEIRGGG